MQDTCAPLGSIDGTIEGTPLLETYNLIAKTFLEKRGIDVTVASRFKSMMEEGPLAGFPVLDVEIDVYDGGYHAVDSSAVAFEIAAKGAFRQSIPKAGPQLLEPIMKVDVFSPEDNVGDVIGDLNRRRGMIKDQEAGATGVRIKADVPLSEMFGYIGHLRTITSGRGQFSMEFSHYSACPQNVADKVIEEAKARKAAK